jgi:hypothetical protein
MRPPTIPRTIAPGVVPGERRLTYAQLLGKPSPGSNPVALADVPGQVTNVREFLRSLGTGTVAGAPAWDTLLAADVTGDVAAVRKFLRSLGSGASAGTTVWDTLTAADIAAGTFPAGTFTFPGSVKVGDGVSAANATVTIAALAGWSAQHVFKHGVNTKWSVGLGAATGLEDYEIFNNVTGKLTATFSSATDLLTLIAGLKVATGFGCNGKSPQTSFSLGAAATDLPTVIALANNLRTMSINNGMGS